MDETVDNIVKTVLGKLSRYSNNDKNWILNEVAGRLMDAGSEYLKNEYINNTEE